MKFTPHVLLLLALPLLSAASLGGSIDARRVARDKLYALGRRQLPISIGLGGDSNSTTTAGSSSSPTPTSTTPTSTSASATPTTPTTTSAPTNTSSPSLTPSTSATSPGTTSSPSAATTSSSTPSGSSASSSLSTTSTTQSQTPTSQSTTSAPVTTSTPMTTTASMVSQITTTNSQGVVVVTQTVIYEESTVFTSGSATSNGTLPTPTSSADSDSTQGSSISQSSIIGLSVAGGVALIGLIAFVIWKFTRKRFGGFDDFEADAIKWPELRNDDTSMMPLPARPTGGAGIETNPSYARSESEFDAASMAAVSTTELNPVGYAAPPYSQPLPPQQYYDEPSTYNTGYYDPYRGGKGGPPPRGASRTSNSQDSVPMGVYGGGRRSPGPERALSDGAESVYTTARSRSPGPMGGAAGEHGQMGSPPSRTRSPGAGLTLANP